VTEPIGESRRSEAPAYLSASLRLPLGASPLSRLWRDGQTRPATPAGADPLPDMRPLSGRRRLLIIARERTAFYEAACREFAGRSDIQVILDRRTGPSEEISSSRMLSRRFLGRRGRREIDALIRATGWAVVYLD
jgi:hypothetical protein